MLTLHKFWCWAFSQHRSLKKVIAILCTIWEHFLLDISPLPSYLKYHWNVPNSSKQIQKEWVNPSELHRQPTSGTHGPKRTWCQISKVGLTGSPSLQRHQRTWCLIWIMGRIQTQESAAFKKTIQEGSIEHFCLALNDLKMIFYDPKAVLVFFLGQFM